MQNDSVTIKHYDLIYRTWGIVGILMFFWVWQYSIVWFVSGLWFGLMVVVFCNSKGIDFIELTKQEKK